MIRNKPRAGIYGIDLGKNVFHVVGTDQTGSVVQRVKFRRETLLAFFERSEPLLIGMGGMPKLAVACEETVGIGPQGSDYFLHNL